MQHPVKLDSCADYLPGEVYLHSPEEHLPLSLCVMTTKLVHININSLSKLMEENIVIANNHKTPNKNPQNKFRQTVNE